MMYIFAQGERELLLLRRLGPRRVELRAVVRQVRAHEVARRECGHERELACHDRGGGPRELLWLGG